MGDGATKVFTGRPQPVEIHHVGIWYSGELLGWRQEGSRVIARVRCTVDKLRHSAWKDLAELRLPDPAHPPRTEARAAALRRPAPAGRDADDGTRPHTLLAALGGRPTRPEHAVTPPAPRRAPGRPPRPVSPQRRREDLPARDAWDERWQDQDHLTAV